MDAEISPAGPWVSQNDYSAGHHHVAVIRIAGFRVIVQGHVGMTDWQWRIDRLVAPWFFAEAKSGDSTISRRSEETAKAAAMAVLATAIYVNSL